jgi:hypothetical protein
VNKAQQKRIKKLEAKLADWEERLKTPAGNRLRETVTASKNARRDGTRMLRENFNLAESRRTKRDATTTEKLIDKERVDRVLGRFSGQVWAADDGPAPASTVETSARVVAQVAEGGFLEAAIVPGKSAPEAAAMAPLPADETTD